MRLNKKAWCKDLSTLVFRLSYQALSSVDEIGQDLFHLDFLRGGKRDFLMQMLETKFQMYDSILVKLQVIDPIGLIDLVAKIFVISFSDSGIRLLEWKG